MKKYFSLNLLIFVILLTTGISAESYRQIQIYFSNRIELIEILQSDLDIDHAEIQSDNSIIVFLGEKEYQRLLDYGYRHKVLIEDWRTYYRNRQKMSKLDQQAQLVQSARNYGVTGFRFGSLGGFYTYSEIVAEMDSMHLQYPNIISEKFSIGQSIEGREIWAVKISDNPNITEDNEAQVCFDALLHAREPGGMSTVIYFMYYLLENYEHDLVVRHLIDHREIYFLPCLNPDGYEYNRQTDPNGGGMWRKNRRDNGNNIFGVDLNRNWDLAFHWDEKGSSSWPSSETYRGDSAFSEPETYYLAQFIKSKNIKTHINYHTYSNMILYPWSYTSVQPPDSSILFEFARDMSCYNNYSFGNGNTIGYYANGVESDWMYAELPDKDKIYSFLFEVGRASDGFWAPEDRIIPLAEANIRANLYLCWLPEAFAAIQEYCFNQSEFLPGDTVDVQFSIKNRGLQLMDNINVHWSDLSGYINFTESSGNIVALDSWQSDTLNARFTISPGVPAGELIQLAIQTFWGDLPMDTDTLSIYAGDQTVFFGDSANGIIAYWNYADSLSPSGWEITPIEFHSAPGAYTDSRDGDYRANSTTIMTMNHPIDLSEIPSPRLSFWTHYEIESNWDCGLVQLSTDSGYSWITLSGQYTISGSGYGRQVKNRPLYDGFQYEWVQEDINLTPFSENTILLRFILMSDEYSNFDGWYIDDIRIYYYSIENPDKLLSEPLANYTFSLSQNYPNPFNPVTTIYYELVDAGHTDLSIYNLRGEQLAVLFNRYQPAGGHEYQLDINKLQPAISSGIYLYVLKSGKQRLVRKMIILK